MEYSPLSPPKIPTLSDSDGVSCSTLQLQGDLLPGVAVFISNPLDVQHCRHSCALPAALRHPEVHSQIPGIKKKKKQKLFSGGFPDRQEKWLCLIFSVKSDKFPSSHVSDTSTAWHGQPGLALWIDTFNHLKLLDYLQGIGCKAASSPHFQSRTFL